MRCRAHLASVAVTSVASLTGCFGTIDDTEPAAHRSDCAPDADDRSDANDQYEVPDGCPVSQDLAVEWPDELDDDAAASFVVAYEAAYVEDVLIGELESQVEDLIYGVGYRPPVEAADRGYLIAVGGGGAYYTPWLDLDEGVRDTPDGAAPVRKADVTDGSLSELLDDAVAEDEAGIQFGPESEIDHSIDSVDALPPAFGRLTGPKSSETAFDVDRVRVALTPAVDSFYGDIGWDARYYVDDHVLWCNPSDDGSPMDGQLLECRTPE